MSSRLELPPIPPGYGAVSSQVFDEDEDVERRRSARVTDDISVATWNVGWPPPGERDAIRHRLASVDTDVIVLAEGDAGVLPDGGHIIDGAADWGYTTPDPARRKISLWSRFPLLLADVVGSANMPPRRFAAATAETGRGPVRIVGVCIPWFDAHVRAGRETARDEHCPYLGPLQRLLASSEEEAPTCVFGDYRVVTEGDVAGLREHTVDHIAVSEALTATDIRRFDRHADAEPARALSDHDLVTCGITREPLHGPRRWANTVPRQES